MVAKNSQSNASFLLPGGFSPAANRRGILIIFFLVGALFLLRMVTPDDLRDRDQVKVCMYILDAAYNDHWICQVDGNGDITSKPPLYNWLGALMVLVFGAGRFAYALPAFFATLLAAWAVWRWTLDLTGDERSGWIAVLCYLATSAVIKQTAYVRTDGLFSGFVALCAWQAWKAWETDRGWWRAWFLAALACLTKGPFAILLGFGGLFAVFWNGRGGQSQKLSLKWWLGVILPILLAGGWAVMAWRIMGHAFYDRIFVRELYGHAVGIDIKMGVNRVIDFIKPPLYLLSRALPWSPAFIWAIWRIFKNPASKPDQRRGERFIAVHIGIGLMALMMAGHKRGDLILPLLPATAVLEGRLLGYLSRSWNWPKLRTIIVAFIGIVLAYESVTLNTRCQDRVVKMGLDEKAFAEKVENDCGLFFPFSFALSYNLQYRMRATRLDMDEAQAAKLLAGKEAVFIVTQDMPRLISALPDGVAYHVLSKDTIRPYGVISNRPSFDLEPDMVVACGEWTLCAKGVIIRRIRGVTAWIEPGAEGTLVFNNAGNRACALSLILPDGSRRQIQAGPGGSVAISVAEIRKPSSGT